MNSVNKNTRFKTVGIIGGLGPDATSRFYLDIIARFQEATETTRPSILIYSVPIPLTVEKDAILRGGSKQECRQILVDAAKTLEKAGADFIVLPCNSLHVFAPDIEKSIQIPFINIVKEAAIYLSSQENVSKVGIISTSFTSDAKLYKTALSKVGIRTLDLKPDEQLEVNYIILRAIYNSTKTRDVEYLSTLVDKLIERKASAVLVACTDLRPLLSAHSKVKLYDTFDILLDTTIKKMTPREFSRGVLNKSQY